MAQTVVPEDVLRAVVEHPEIWPAILECQAWFSDAKTGRVEFIFGNGGLKDMLRHEHLAMGRSVELPAGMEPHCPACRGEVEWHDHRNKVYCRSCDRTLTVWEIKQGQHYHPASRGRLDGLDLTASQARR